MSAPSQNSRRQAQDVLKLMKSYKVDVIEENRQLVVRFLGPPGTPYHGGVWKVLVIIFMEYPFKPPSIRFMNRIFHPNINKITGNVCVDVLEEKWLPVFNLNMVFDIFLPQLLAHPNPDDSLNVSTALMYKRGPQVFNSYVKKHVALHATDKVLDVSEEERSEQ